MLHYTVWFVHHLYAHIYMVSNIPIEHQKLAKQLYGFKQLIVIIIIASSKYSSWIICTQLYDIKYYSLYIAVHISSFG